MSFFYPKRRVPINDEVKQVVSEALLAQRPKNTKDLNTYANSLTQRLFSPRVASAQDVIAKYLSMDPPDEKDRGKIIDAATREVQQTAGKQAGDTEGTPEFSFPRLLGSIIFLLVILGLSFLAAKVTEWQSFSSYLQHAFELLLGGTVALIVGSGEK